MSGSFQALLASASGGVVLTFTASVTKFVFPTASAVTCSIAFMTDGTLVGGQGGPGGGFTDNATGKNWFLPTTAGAGAFYWIRATLLSGSTPSTGPALGAWVQLNTTPTWGYNSGTGGAASTREGQLTVHIASDAAGANILGTGTLTFAASRES
jgi:hypothetical protein